MAEREVQVSAGDLLRWIEAEKEGEFANLHLNARSEVAGRGAEARERAILAIEPMVERNWWVLRIVFERPAQSRGRAPAMGFEDFVLAYREAPRLAETVRVEAQTDEAAARFDAWLDDLRRRRG